jgi:hypothetical protein
MLAAKRRHMQQAAKVYWTRVGYENFQRLSVIANYRRAIAKRSAIFAELAPVSHAMMTPAELEAAINRCRNPKDGTMRPIRNYRTWVKKNYR